MRIRHATVTALLPRIGDKGASSGTRQGIPPTIRHGCAQGWTPSREQRQQDAAHGEPYRRLRRAFFVGAADLVRLEHVDAQPGTPRVSFGRSRDHRGPRRRVGDIRSGLSSVQGAAAQAAVIMNIAGQRPAEQQPMVQRQPLDDPAHHGVDQGGAVGGNGVVEARLHAPVGWPAPPVPAAARDARAGRATPDRGSPLRRARCCAGVRRRVIGGDDRQLEALEEPADLREGLSGARAVPPPRRPRSHSMRPCSSAEAEGEQHVGNTRAPQPETNRSREASRRRLVLAPLPATSASSRVSQSKQRTWSSTSHSPWRRPVARWATSSAHARSLAGVSPPPPAQQQQHAHRHHQGRTQPGPLPVPHQAEATQQQPGEGGETAPGNAGGKAMQHARPPHSEHTSTRRRSTFILTYSGDIVLTVIPFCHFLWAFSKP